MGRIVALAGMKGGTGKSTVAINLAAEWKARGYRVLLIDADPQGTSLEWSEVAAEEGHAAPDVVAIGDNLRDALPGLAAGYDVVVIDTAGRLSGRLVGALAVADLALLPCGPGSADVWAIGKSLETVEEVRQIRRDLQVAIVVNQKTRTALGRSLRESLESLGVAVTRSELGSRVAFAEAPASGLGVTTYASGSVAANEMRRLTDEVEEMLGMVPLMEGGHADA